MIIRELSSFDEYEDFIGEMSRHPLYSDPHFAHSKNNLYKSTDDEDERAFAVLNGGNTEGLFVWLILPEDRFIEMIIGFTANPEAFSEMVSFIEETYPGYSIDFVFNPRNPAISEPLREKGAVFDPVQRKMLHTGALPNVSTAKIELYSDKFKEQYCELHRKETYWTAERVLAAQERFRVLLAVDGGQVTGYLDVTRCYDENEIYDLFVTPEAADRGYGLALAAKAAELNGAQGMMVLVDEDAEAEIKLYSQAGFEFREGYDSVLASYRIKKQPKI